MQIELSIDLEKIEIDGEYYDLLQEIIRQEIESELRAQVRERFRHNREVRNLANKLGGIVIAELTLATKKQEEPEVNNE